MITYDWRVHATKPLLRRLGWLLNAPTTRPVTGSTENPAAMGHDALEVQESFRNIKGGVMNWERDLHGFNEPLEPDEACPR